MERETIERYAALDAKTNNAMTEMEGLVKALSESSSDKSLSKIVSSKI